MLYISIVIIVCVDLCKKLLIRNKSIFLEMSNELFVRANIVVFFVTTCSGGYYN